MDEPNGMNDASMPDAAMMDPMDDLFGEAADGLGVSLPPMPLPATVVLRTAEMQRSGCCTKLAWSNTGSIAQISPDGSEIDFRVMLRDPKAAKWKLTEKSGIPLKCPEGRQFVHVQFNGVGIELAAVDNMGSVYPYTVVGALNRMQQAPSRSNPAEMAGSDLDAVVGMHWLPLSPTEFRSPFITPSSKSDGRWITQTRARDPKASKPHSPLDNKNALVHVSSIGKLSLVYQNEAGLYMTVNADLESFGSSDDLISHAAFGGEGSNLLLATHDEARRLRLYKITINWNANQATGPNGNYMTVTPTLEIGHLTALDRATAQISDIARLSHLQVLPVPVDPSDQSASSPTQIFAVFTHAASPIESMQPAPETISILARWKVETLTPTLHESFKKLKPNGTTPITTTSTILRREQDVISNKLVVSVESQCSNTLLLLAASDGTVDFRERSTFNSIEPYGDTTSVTSLPQTGLEHVQNGSQYSQIALSSDGSALVGRRADGKVDPQFMTLHYGWQPVEDGITDSKGRIETAVVCLARQYSILSYNSAANDDPIALLPSDLSTELRALFVKETVRMTGGRPDLAMLENSKQQMTLFKDPFVPRAISAQLVLGTKPNSNERAFGGQFAYIVLNMRYISMALAQTVGQKMSDMSRIEVPLSLLAPVQWASDILMYIVQQIIAVQRSKTSTQTNKEAFAKAIAETGNPALHLVLCSVSRAILRSHIMYIPAFLRVVQASMPRTTSIHERQQLEGAFERAKALPFTFKPFQDFLNEFDTAVRSAYTTSGASQEKRTEIELAMLSEGAIPAELEPALESLFSTSLPKIMSATDAGKLYFWDTTWLGITQSSPSNAQQLDAILKTPMKKGSKRRVCRRCGAEMEDLTHEEARAGPMWLLHAQRHCYCLNSWWLK